MNSLRNGRKDFVLSAALTLLTGIFFSANARAESITIQGKVSDAANTPVTGAATQFRVKIISPDANKCVLYDETQTLDLSQTGGLFSLNLNNGLGTQNAPATYNLDDALSNRTSFSISSAYCASGTGTISYTPAADHNRKIVISFRDPGTMPAFETIPEMDLNPMAYAMEARRTGGFPATALLRVVNGSGVPASTTALTTSNFTELLAVLGGTSTNYMSSTSGSTTGARLPTVAGDPSSPTAGSLWFDTNGSGALKYKDAAGVIQTVGNSGGSLITSVSAGTGITASTTSGAVTVGLQAISPTSPAGDFGSATSVPVIRVDAYGRVTQTGSAAISGTLPAGTAGEFLKYSAGAWSSAAVRMSDLKNATGAPALFGSTTCLASETFYWDSGTDQFKCQSIALGAPSATVAATYAKVTVAADGRVNGGTATLSNADISSLDWGKITTGKPTSITGYASDAMVNALNTASFATGPTSSQPTGHTAGRVFIDTTLQKIQYDNGSAWIDVASNGGTGFAGSLSGEVTGTQGATSVDHISTYDRTALLTILSNVTNATNAATGSAIVKRDGNGDFAGRKISSSELLLKDGTTNTVSLKANSSSATYSLQLPAAAPGANQQLQSDSSGVLSWITPSTFSAGSIAVTSPITNTAGTIGINQANTSQGGFLSNTDWNTFNNKLASSLADAKIWIGVGTTPTAAAPSGDVSMTNAGAFTVEKIKGTGVTAAASATGQVLRYNGTNYAPTLLSLADIRSNVSGASTFGTTCSASQTLTWVSGTDTLSCQNIGISAATQISGVLPIANGGTGTDTAGQNLIFAGPASGGAGAPSFRALAASDLPASASFWDSATGGINYAGGNVGIGTSAPAGRLDVRGGASATGDGSAINVIGQSGAAGGDGAGGVINVTAGNATASSANKIGGDITITSGNGASTSNNASAGRGGALALKAGNGGTFGNGGAVSLKAGDPGTSGGTGGGVTITAANASEGAGGSVSISSGTAGTATSGNQAGGAISLTAGDAVGTSAGGQINIQAGRNPTSNIYAPIALAGSGGGVGIGTTNPNGYLNVRGLPFSLGSLTMTAATGASGGTFSGNVTLNNGDYLVPNGTTLTKTQGRTVLASTGNTFTTLAPYTAPVNGETFNVFRPILALQSNASSKMYVQGSTGRTGFGIAFPTAIVDAYGGLANQQNMGMRGVLSATHTVSGAYSDVGLQFVNMIKLDTSVTNSAVTSGMDVGNLRNYSGTGDNGTSTEARGLNLSYGHYNADAGATPQTTSASGIVLAPYAATGTIGTLYDLRILGTVAGGTITTKHYGISQEDANVTNYFAGNTGIGTNAPASRLHVQNSSGATATVEHLGSGTVTAIAFRQGNPSVQVGAITMTGGSSTAYGTTSDRRTKENFTKASVGLADLLRLPVHEYSYRTDSEHRRVNGFVAQELYKIYPDAVTTNGDDGLAPLGSAQPWSVDYGRITPLLTQSIKDLASLLSSTKQSLSDRLFRAEARTESIAAENARLKQDSANQTRDIASLKQENAAMKERLDRLEKLLTK